jgi:hypothetical protein
VEQLTPLVKKAKMIKKLKDNTLKTPESKTLNSSQEQTCYP